MASIQSILTLPQPWEGMAIATLPNGFTASFPYAQWARVWEAWIVVAPAAAMAGVGLSIAVSDDGDVEIKSVYSAQWEGYATVIRPDGTFVQGSEQSCPF